MGKLKRYELYEGDGETITAGEEAEERKTALPGRQPLGRDAGLRERDAFDRRQEEQKKHRYFAGNEDDGLGAPSTLFDDFDRFNSSPVTEERPEYRRPMKHRAAWITVIVLCLTALLGMTVLVLPQLTGLRYRFLPNLVFINGNILQLDPQREENFNLYRAELFTDKIYPGIYIDGVHVGGMSREQAAAAVESVNENEDRTFDILLSVGNESWHVNNSRVPVSRNTAEIVERAWASGRSNTSRLHGTGMTPFQERINQASEIRSFPVTFRTRQDFDHEALRAMTDGVVNYVNREPVNSTVQSFDFNTHTFTFTDDIPGARLDADQLYSQLAEMLDAGAVQSELRVVPEKVLADITRTELINRFGMISAYTTNTTSNKNRNTNIQLSAQAINGCTVMPGEIFSFNAATGERTAAKGYKEAAAIAGGQSRDEIGGGVCQTSSTLFNAVARANLEILERNPHAWPSSYVEKGFDATVNWPGLDFKFRNNTDWPIFIVAAYAKQKVTVNLYGMSLGNDVKIELESITTKELSKPEGINYVINTSLAPGESKKTVTGRKGYEVETWKVWYQGGQVSKRELLFKTTYRPYQETWEYNPQ